MKTSRNLVITCKLFSNLLCITVLVLDSVTGIGDIFALQQLGPINVHRLGVTLSGFSSGGTFAQQMFFSHSSKIAGIGVFSHSYYRCGPGDGSQDNYDAACTNIGARRRQRAWNYKRSIRDVETYARKGLIDDPYRYLKGKLLYIFAGTKNYLFSKENSLKAVDVFKPFINSRNAIRVQIARANLTMPSNRIDLELPKCEAPPKNESVSFCGFSGAYVALKHILGSRAIYSKPPKDKKKIKLQPLLQFDQTPFFPKVGADNHAAEIGFDIKRLRLRARHDMDTTGYIYTPKACQFGKEKCFLHVYFHGCLSGREFVGPNHAVKSGFLEVAEANKIIVVFPQVVSSKENPLGCWDTFGYTGKLYATKAGAQIETVMAMMDRLLGWV